MALFGFLTGCEVVSGVRSNDENIRLATLPLDCIEHSIRSVSGITSIVREQNENKNHIFRYEWVDDKTAGQWKNVSPVLTIEEIKPTEYRFNHEFVSLEKKDFMGFITNTKYGMPQGLKDAATLVIRDVNSALQKSCQIPLKGEVKQF